MSAHKTQHALIRHKGARFSMPVMPRALRRFVMGLALFSLPFGAEAKKSSVNEAVPTLQELQYSNYSHKNPERPVNMGVRLKPLSTQNLRNIAQLVQDYDLYDASFEEAALRSGVPAIYVKIVCAIESRLRKDTRSHANALGVAQFIPSTGRLMGLTVNNRVDERLDPHRSILASADYIAYLLSQSNGHFMTRNGTYGALARYFGTSGESWKQYEANAKAVLDHFNLPTRLDTDHIVRFTQKNGRLVAVNRDVASPQYDAALSTSVFASASVSNPRNTIRYEEIKSLPTEEELEQEYSITALLKKNREKPVYETRYATEDAPIQSDVQAPIQTNAQSVSFMDKAVASVTAAFHSFASHDDVEKTEPEPTHAQIVSILDHAAPMVDEISSVDTPSIDIQDTHTSPKTGEMFNLRQNLAVSMVAKKPDLSGPPEPENDDSESDKQNSTKDDFDTSLQAVLRNSSRKSKILKSAEPLHNAFIKDNTLPDYTRSQALYQEFQESYYRMGLDKKRPAHLPRPHVAQNIRATI